MIKQVKRVISPEQVFRKKVQSLFLSMTVLRIVMYVPRIKLITAVYRYDLGKIKHI